MEGRSFPACGCLQRLVSSLFSQPWISTDEHEYL